MLYLRFSPRANGHSVMISIIILVTKRRRTRRIRRKKKGNSKLTVRAGRGPGSLGLPARHPALADDALVVPAVPRPDHLPVDTDARRRVPARRRAARAALAALQPFLVRVRGPVPAFSLSSSSLAPVPGREHVREGGRHHEGGYVVPEAHRVLLPPSLSFFFTPFISFSVFFFFFPFFLLLPLSSASS